MKKLDNKQKFIWDHSVHADLPPLPNKEDVWLRLVQHMEILIGKRVQTGIARKSTQLCRISGH